MSRILIVEDDRHLRDTIGRYFAGAGHHVEIETDGALALERVFGRPERQPPRRLLSSTATFLSTSPPTRRGSPDASSR